MGVETFDGAYALIGFIGTAGAFLGGLLYGGYRLVKWLRDQQAAMFDGHQATLVKKVDDLATSQTEYQDETREAFKDMNKKVGDLALGVRSVEVEQNQHAQRIAWLEGQSGQPLGTVTRERTFQ